ncbi:interleukin-20-like [Arapaima gigas]
MTTKTSSAAPALLLLALLAAGWRPAAGRRLRLGFCPVTVHIHELRHSFSEMRQSAVSDSKQCYLKHWLWLLLSSQQPSESCCFFKHMLGFYVERVFSGYTIMQSKHRKSTSNLANSFLSIKRDLRQCHEQVLCECQEKTRLTLAAIRSSFDKLEPKDAVVKAVGELDSLLDWLESFAP